MKVRTLLTTSLVLAGVLATAPSAMADWSPRFCGTNGLDLKLDKDTTIVRPGDTITYSLGVRNDAAGSCDVTEGFVTIALPGADGLPQRAAARTLTTNRLFRAGLTLTPIDVVPYVVAVNPGVTNVTPEGRAAGALHDSDLNNGVADILKTVNSQVTQPSLTIDKTGSIDAGLAPQNVVYTYIVTNTSSTPVPMNQVAVSDDLCVGPKYSSGDDGNGLLTNGEKWTFTCSALHQAPGVYTNTAYACAKSTVRGDETRPVCSPPDTWTVTLTGPPPVVVPAPKPQVVVKPTTAAQAPCTLARATKTTVRAGQLNTIRVRVRNLDAGSTVKITLPGGKVVSDKTDKSGMAVFKVRPPKSGTATIRAAECSDVERLSVKPARRVVAKRAPRVTG
jgi:hypothetical protein